MEVLTFLIAVVALAFSIMALQRTGGLKDLRRQLDEVAKKSEEATKGARETAADALSRLEGFIRGGGKPSEGPPSTTEEKPQDDKQSSSEEKQP